MIKKDLIWTKHHGLKNAVAFSYGNGMVLEGDISYILKSDSSNKDYFMSQSPQSSILIDFGEEISITDFSIEGVSVPYTSPKLMIHFLTSWSIFTPLNDDFTELKQIFDIKNSKLNYCFDTAFFKFNKPVNVRRLILKGDRVYSQMGGYVIKTIKFYNKDVEYKVNSEFIGS